MEFECNYSLENHYQVSSVINYFNKPPNVHHHHPPCTVSLNSIRLTALRDGYPCRPDPLLLEYRLISKKGEGTFSEVLKAQSIKTGKFVAIKCMKNHFDNIEQVTPFSFNLLGQ